MKKIFETSKIKEIDRYTIENEPVESIDLVERAASVFVNEFCRRYTSRGNRILVFAGQGNNGADALAVSRILTERGYNVFTYLINPSNTLSAECEENRRRITDGDSRQFVEVASSFAPPALKPQDIVVDGLFGYGLNRPLEGGFAGIVKYINESEATVVSIDIPSGLFGEDNRENNLQHVVQADLTLTFEFPKLSFLLPENADFVGEWKMLPVGLHPDALRETKTPYGLITDEDVAALVRRRERFAHKGDFGHALLIAGSRGKIGAAILSAGSCLRSGAGLLTVRVPGRGETALQTALPEAMTEADAHSDFITGLPPDFSRYDAVGIGPGLGLDGRTKTVVAELLDIAAAEKKPLVLDADALNIIADNSELLHRLPPGAIVTPHPKEFDRLAGRSENACERIQKARSMADEQKICIVLKGAYTAVCTPSGKVFFNTSGNPGMATAGSGDVLTGIILALLAQGYSPEESSVIAVYIHGIAGNLAASSLSEESMIAGDITSMLGKAFKQMHNDDLPYLSD
ncbi:MAG: NAD(P)H-hydrate dehydratase [Tannerella sp.]|jgi:NAD(P)H-hydrate epimerase|nr:NAD(P)H-hydrate dehydratase [Tannerella sp.]